MAIMRPEKPESVQEAPGRPGRSITIRDVAKLAGVSPGTVSRAVRNSPLVNRETGKRILEIAAQLDYQPNLAARRLVLGQTLTIALFAPFSVRAGVNDLLSAVLHALADSEYDLVLHHIASSADRERGFAAFPGRSQVDGVLLLSVGPAEEEVEVLQKAGVPIVIAGTCDPLAGRFHRLSVDDLGGGRAAAQHLLDLGHEGIGFLGDSSDHAFSMHESDEKCRGYRQALEDLGLTAVEALIRECPPDWKTAQGVATEMLSEPDRPTAILASTDRQAAGVLKAAAEMGIRVPEELSVVGCGGGDLAEILELTSLQQPLFDLGMEAVAVLLEAIEKPASAPVHRALPAEIVQRHTTGPIRP